MASSNHLLATCEGLVCHQIAQRMLCFIERDTIGPQSAWKRSEGATRHCGGTEYSHQVDQMAHYCHPWKVGDAVCGDRLEQLEIAGYHVRTGRRAAMNTSTKTTSQTTRRVVYGCRGWERRADHALNSLRNVNTKWEEVDNEHSHRGNQMATSRLLVKGGVWGG